MRRQDPDGTVLRYRYEANLSLIGLLNGKGERYTFGYDLAGQLIDEVGFDGRARRYAYEQATTCEVLDKHEAR